jgi:protein-tyrosine phosphatase
MLGAEVLYYQGISRLAGLKDLRVEGSPVLLLEMPISRWSEGIIRELIELSSMGGVKLVLAHIERYLKDQPKRTWLRLLEAGVLMQVNAPFFADLRTRRSALKLLKNHSIHFLGSDCHNLTDRAPRLEEAEAVIRKKMGEDFTDQWIAFGESWFV